MSTVPGSTDWPSVATRPSTDTRPSAMSRSAARREATPAEARTFWSRSGAISARDPVRPGRVRRRPDREPRPGRGRAGTGARPAGARAGARLGGALGLRRGLEHPRRDLRVERRQLLQAGDPEPLEELEVGPVQVRPPRRLRSAELDDEPAMEQGPDRVVRVDPADALDGGLRDGLAVGHDGERLERRRRKTARPRPDVAPDEAARLGSRGQLDPVARVHQPDPPTLRGSPRGRRGARRPSPGRRRRSRRSRAA